MQNIIVVNAFCSLTMYVNVGGYFNSTTNYSLKVIEENLPFDTISRKMEHYNRWYFFICTSIVGYWIAEHGGGFTFF